MASLIKRGISLFSRQPTSKLVLSKLFSSHDPPLLHSSNYFKCFLCDFKYEFYTGIHLHIKDYECILKDAILPPPEPDKIKTDLALDDVLRPDFLKKILPVPLKYIHHVFTNEANKELLNIIWKNPKDFIVVFLDSPSRARALDAMLQKCFIRSTHIHRLMECKERNHIVDLVKERAAFSILVTTDLDDYIDIGNVDIIVHFDFPYPPNLSLYKKRVFTFGAPTKEVFLFRPLVLYPPALSPPFTDNRFHFELSSKSVEIPNDMVGVLIGKGGKNLEIISFSSGSKIFVTKDVDADPHSPTRTVTISGTLIEISKALILITKHISKVKNLFRRRTRGKTPSDEDIPNLFRGRQTGGCVGSFPHQCNKSIMPPDFVRAALASSSASQSSGQTPRQVWNANADFDPSCFWKRRGQPSDRFTGKEHRVPFGFSEEYGSLPVGAESAVNAMPAQRVKASDNDLLLSTSEESKVLINNCSAYNAPAYDASSVALAGSQAHSPQLALAIDDLLAAKAVLDPITFLKKWSQLPTSLSQVCSISPKGVAALTTHEVLGRHR